MTRKLANVLNGIVSGEALDNALALDRIYARRARELARASKESESYLEELQAQLEYQARLQVGLDIYIALCNIIG